MRLNWSKTTPGKGLGVFIAAAVLLAGCTVEDRSQPGDTETPSGATPPRDTEETSQDPGRSGNETSFGARLQDCVAVTNPDEVGDVAVYPGLVPDAGHQHDAIDLVSIAITRMGTEVQLTLDLVALPATGATTDLAYRYWLGFHVVPEGGDAEYMDVRIHTYPYAEGYLITSNQQGNERIGTYPVEANGTTWVVRFPFQVVQEVYGDVPITLGAPEVQADGPQPQVGLQSTKYVDYNFWEGDFVAAVPCAPGDD